MKRFKIEMKWALIYSVSLICWMFIEKTVGLHDRYIDRQLLLTNLFGIVGALIFFFAIREKKINYYGNSMYWTQGFLSGVYLAVFIAILGPLVNYITYNVISPDYFENMIRYYVTEGLQKKENAELFFSLRSYVIQGSMGGLSAGILASAAIALILRNKKQII